MRLAKPFGGGPSESFGLTQSILANTSFTQDLVDGESF